MNSQRARQIANSFARVNEFQVEEVSGGLLVRQGGHSCYFVRESSFWPFVFKAADASRSAVIDIEMKLAA